YKRSEDGIVLVDQDRCRGWRMCVTGCPYKKIYFNHKTGKAEKCTFCYPRVEVGLPTVCSETCVGRLRYLGVMLYDADRVAEAAAADDPYEAQLSIFVDPDDPAVAASGIPDDWVDAARRSPVWDLIMRYRIALPLHPEYRTLPMVWYVPPLSPVVDALATSGHDGEDAGNLFAAVEALRIPVDYLAGLFTGGDPVPVTAALRRLAAMRSYQRAVNLGEEPELAEAGLSEDDIKDMFRLLALARYDERYVIPTAHGHVPGSADEPGCSLDYDGGPGMQGPFGESSGRPVPVSIESFHGLKQRQAGEEVSHERVNLLNWDGRGTPAGLFPPRKGKP
ncbi:MAG: nitrate reductase subunit beta, partial [Nonomuraea sp.]|nr:nitrate reductase subunit beta [Nonomuraea sp.]